MNKTFLNISIDFPTILIQNNSRIVMRLERLFKIPVPDIVNPLSYRKLNEEAPFDGEIEPP